MREKILFSELASGLVSEDTKWHK